jgi:IS30 family transposase
MGRRKDLTSAEKQSIATNLKNGLSTLQISKMLKRDHRTIKKLLITFFTNENKTKERDSRTFLNETYDS